MPDTEIIPAGDAGTTPPPAAPATLLTGAPPVTPPPGDGTTPPPAAPVTPPPDAGDWKAGLPEVFRQPSMKAFLDAAKTPEELQEMVASGFVSTKAMVGKKLEMPGEGATPEQMANWRKVTGAPDTPEGYGDLKPADIPAELWNKEGADKFLALAHKHGTAPAFVKEALALQAEIMKGEIQTAEAQGAAALEAATTSLRAEWGGQFDANIASAQRYAETIGLDPQHPACADPDVVKALARGAALIGEDKLVTGQARGIAGAHEKIQEIMDPKGASMLSRQYRGEFGAEQQQAAGTELLRLQQSVTK